MDYKYIYYLIIQLNDEERSMHVYSSENYKWRYAMNQDATVSYIMVEGLEKEHETIGYNMSSLLYFKETKKIRRNGDGYDNGTLCSNSIYCVDDNFNPIQEALLSKKRRNHNNR